MHSVAVVLISKQLFIFFSTAQTLWNVKTPFRAKFLKLIELITCNDLALIEILLLGDNSFSQYGNSRILDAAIAFIVTSKRFDDPLLV